MPKLCPSYAPCKEPKQQDLEQNSGLACELPLIQTAACGHRTGIASGELVLFATSAASGLGVATSSSRSSRHFIHIDS